jgi:hypothetical protein
MKPITIGFSIQRSEVIDIAADLMQRHDVIFLEEPSANGLQEMLQGALSVDDYLLPAEVEYPEFSRRMCRFLRMLSGRHTAEAVIKELAETPESISITQR